MTCVTLVALHRTDDPIAGHSPEAYVRSERSNRRDSPWGQAQGGEGPRGRHGTCSPASSSSERALDPSGAAAAEGPRLSAFKLVEGPGATSHRVANGLPRALNAAAVAALIAVASAGKALVDDACAKKAVAELTRD